MNTNTDSFDLDQARELMVLWTRQLEEARRLREQYWRIENGLQRMISGIRTVFPELSNIPGPSDESRKARQADDDNEADVAEVAPEPARRPRRMTSVDVVATVVNDSPGEEWLTVPQVAAEVEQRGWTPRAVDPEAAIRTALSRAAAAGRIDSTSLDGRTKGYRRRRTPSDTETIATAQAAFEGSPADDRSHGEEEHAAAGVATAGRGLPKALALPRPILIDLRDNGSALHPGE
jgi:hypothetical protein